MFQDGAADLSSWDSMFDTDFAEHLLEANQILSRNPGITPERTSQVAIRIWPTARAVLFQRDAAGTGELESTLVGSARASCRQGAVGGHWPSIDLRALYGH
jgi:hypothetical protein